MQKPTAQPTSWEQLQQEENEALQERRLKVSPALTSEQSNPASGAGAIPRIGLALSGGGVRSATFALGLLRGMAQSSHPRTPPTGAETGAQALSRDGLLGRIDYLSSVSGGGYVAAMLGRLIQKPVQAAEQSPPPHQTAGCCKPSGPWATTTAPCSIGCAATVAISAPEAHVTWASWR